MHVAQHADIGTWRFANLLQLVIFARTIAAETMRLVYDDKVELLFVLVLVTSVKHLRQTAVGDELRFLIYSELLERLFQLSSSAGG